MKKKFFILLALIFVLSACSADNTNYSINEQNAPESMNDYDSTKVMEEIDNINDGTANNKKSVEKETKIEEAPADSNEEILTNNQTSNMNTAVINTNKGVIKIKLNPEKAPLTVENFKKYIESAFYDGTIFHRVIDGFMIQGGGFVKDGSQKSTNDPIRIESDNGLKNDRGTIAMARTMVPNSATSQFFINLVDNDMLNYQAPTTQGYGYAVFGEVIEGMDVVDAIAKVETGSKGGHDDWPEEDVLINSVTLE